MALLDKPTYLTLEDVPEAAPDIRQRLRLQEGLSGVIIEKFLLHSEYAEALTSVYVLQPYWRRGTCEGEYTLGRGWYTSIDNREVMDYFEEAPPLNALILEHFPSLIAKILVFCQKFTRQSYIPIRSGWAGPGIVIFSAHCGTAQNAGSCHIDYEGLSRRMLDHDKTLECYSFMLPIHLPEQGGNLKVWPEVYQQFRHERYLNEVLDPSGEPVVLPYTVGSLHGINSMRLHQIESFEVPSDRVVVTFHLACLNNQWCIWF